MVDPLFDVADLAVAVHREPGSVGLSSAADPAAPLGEGWTQVVAAASFAVGAGEVVAMVGESASGKSLMLMGAIDLLSPGARVIRGRTTFQGDTLLDVGSAAEVAEVHGPVPKRGPAERRLLGRGIGVIFQDPIGAWDPAQLIGRQSGEALAEHTEMSPAEIRARVLDALGEVKLSRRHKFASFASELSRGEAQRAMLAAALIAGPQLLIADEPLSGLDVTVAAAVLQLMDDLRRRRGMAMVLATHDLATVAAVADRVLVVYGGRIVEKGPVGAIFHRPRHPYTSGLLASVPGAARGRLRPIPGDPPDIAVLPPGCAFAPRCAFAVAACRSAVPGPRRVGETVANCIRAGELDLAGVGGPDSA